MYTLFFFFSSRRRHTRFKCDWSSDVCSSDLIVKLTAAALRQHPLLQAQWREDGLFVPERVDIAVAVDTQACLLVPAIRRAHRLPLRQIPGPTRPRLARARARRPPAADMPGAALTFTH